MPADRLGRKLQRARDLKNRLDDEFQAAAKRAIELERRYMSAKREYETLLQEARRKGETDLLWRVRGGKLPSKE